MANAIKAVIYGDSIMNGTVMDQANSYITTMGEILRGLRERFNIEANNRSHYGITVAQGQKMLEHDLRKGLECDYALVEFGGNDCNFKWDEISARPQDEHLPRTALNRFQDIYVSMAENLKRAGVRPVMMTLPPIDAERYLQFLGRRGNDCRHILKWLGDVNMIYRFHESYSRTVEKIAQKTGSILVDVRSYFLDKHNFRDLICEDGIHPNQQGYQLLLQAFEDYISERLSSRAIKAV